MRRKWIPIGLNSLNISVTHDMLDLTRHTVLWAWLSLKLRKSSLTPGSGDVVLLEVERGRHKEVGVAENV